MLTSPPPPMFLLLIIRIGRGGSNRGGPLDAPHVHGRCGGHDNSCCRSGHLSLQRGEADAKPLSLFERNGELPLRRRLPPLRCLQHRNPFRSAASHSAALARPLTAAKAAPRMAPDRAARSALKLAIRSRCLASSPSSAAARRRRCAAVSASVSAAAAEAAAPLLKKKKTRSTSPRSPVAYNRSNCGQRMFCFPIDRIYPL